MNEYVKNCLLLSFELHATEDWKPALDYATEDLLEARKQLKFGTDAALQLMVFDLLGLRARCAARLNTPAEADEAFRDAIRFYKSFIEKRESGNEDFGMDLAVEFLKYLKEQNRQHTAEADIVRTSAVGWLETARRHTTPDSPEPQEYGEWQRKLDDTM